MRRPVAQAVLLLLVGVLGGAIACGDDDNAGPPAGMSGSAGTSAGGDNGAAGSSTTEGGVPTGGGAANAGAPNATGGAPVGNAGVGGETTQAGMPGLGDAGSPAQGGAGPDMPGPPDLITSTGGPWPDSLTASCANATKVIPCPQLNDDFFGQDGTYRLNVPSYTSTATTMTDKVTALSWQIVAEETQKTQAEAVTYCDNLDLGGHTDWRLPTRLEYVSVLDEGMGSGTAMPPAIPVDTQGTHWTASASGTTANAFFVMDDLSGVWNVAAGDTKLLARCVRGAVHGGSLTVDTDVVTDDMTSLMWQATALDDTFVTWQAALAYCEGLSHAGRADWRLPSIKELATLVDEGALLAPVISADFGDGLAAQYWSSTPVLSFGSERYAFTLATDFGASPSQKISDAAAAARCVRSAD